MKKILVGMVCSTILFTGLGGSQAHATEQSRQEVPAIQSESEVSVADLYESPEFHSVEVDRNATVGDIQAVTENTVVSEIEYDSLSKAAKKHFAQDDFTENDEYYTQTTTQVNPNVKGTRAVNVIVQTGSTKKINNTMAYTSYIITATQAPFKTFTTKVSLGTAKSVSSTVNPYAGTYAYAGGVYISFSGKSRYFTVKLNTQYTTTWGSGTVNCNAGGVTLGK